jgi:hypothetical protein
MAMPLLLDAVANWTMVLVPPQSWLRRRCHHPDAFFKLLL